MTTVPSNLVPTKITDLPVAPNPTPNATMVCVIGGVTYQVAFIDLQSLISVPASREINTGGGLQGGGNLTQDRTFSIATGGVTNDKLADNGVTPGTYGSGSSIPVVSIDAKGLVTNVTEQALVISGYVPDTRQIIAGTGLTGGGNLQADRTISMVFSSTPPAALGTVSVGLEDNAARGDHVHPALDFANLSEYTGLLPLTHGGTGKQINSLTAGTVWYTDGTNGFLQTTQGVNGQVLISSGAAAPTWGSALIVSDQPANYVYAGPTSGVAAPTTFRLLVNDDIPSLLTGKSMSGSANTFSNIPNVALSNYSVTFNGQTVALGDSGTITATTTSTLTIGTGLTGTSFNGSSPVTIAIDSTVATLTGSQTLTNKSISGSTNTLTNIPNSALTNSSVTIGSTSVALGGTTTTLAGLTTVTVTQDPTTALELATKQYVDSIASGLNYHQPVNYASVAALPAYTYNNGASGVGATITAVANGALSFGGGSPTVGQRLLVKDEIGANEPYNGVYTVTQTGSLLLPFILTRATDYDTSGTGTNEIDAGDYVLVISGTNASTAWVQQTPLPITVGTTALVFLQFNAPLTYSAGTGLNLSPATTFNISNTGVTATSYGSASSVATFTVNAQGQLTSASNTTIAIANTQVSGLGTMSTQNANSVAITGGAIDSTTIGATTASTVKATTVATTGAGSSADGAGQVYLNGSSSNRVEWSAVGTGAPAFTTRTAGTKLLLYPAISGSQVDYAIGINSATLWSSIPVASSSFYFKWYGGQTEVASLDGTGAFTATSFAGAGTGLTGTASALSIGGNAATATSATNLAGGVAGAVPYQSGVGATSFSAAGTSGDFLISGGTGSPTWTSTISGGTYV